ncbi:glycerophosphodiester phosphodiesterase family protein, partial [Bittarella massiliensis (ex Durand et al. 2017)]
MTLFEEIAQSRGKRLLVGGHRGHLSQVRENTLENFAEVAGLGLSHIEIDVQLSK